MAKRKAPRWCYWRGDILWCRIVVDGREIRESLRTSSVEIARKRAEETRSKIIGASRGEIVPSWEDAVAGWAEQIGNTVGARTALRYEQSIRTIGNFFAEIPVADITMKTVSAMVAARQKAVSNATIRRDLTAVASVLDFSIDEEWRDDNPAREKSRRLSENRDPVTLPPAEDIETVLFPMTGGIESIARFAWATGCRLSEITNLTRRQIAGNLAYIKGKGNKGRTIELNADALAIISRQPVSIETDLVFHHDGVGYSCVSTNFGRAVATAQKKAQRERRDFTAFRFHDLRHVFAVDTLRSGRMGLYELSKYLGHTSVMTTERHYLEYLTPEQAKVAKDGTKSGTGAAVPSVPKTA